jgi:MFS family permease
MKKVFYGWWVTAAAFITFGLAVGFPYYNISFFYTYFAKDFGWSKQQITFGFPLAALLTLWVGPVLVPKFSPRKLILVGTGLTVITFLGFGLMGGSLWVYYALWFTYTVGYILSGPIPHQLMISHWFRKNRGKAMGVAYVGVGLIASLGSYLAKPLAENYGYRAALMILGSMILLAWPLAFFVLRDKPADKGLYPDGASGPPADSQVEAHSYKYLLSQYSFWLLLIGSFCSIGSIGAVNFHMKFVFQDQGFRDEILLNSIWRVASIIILWSSIGGRLGIGGLADRFSKKWVMASTYLITAATIPLLLQVVPPETPWAFAILFGLGMGADYMLIPLMAAEQFGLNSLARAMAIILPVNTIGQTWFPYFVSFLREHFGNYTVAMGAVFGVAVLGSIAIALMPKQDKPDAALHIPQPERASTGH